MLFKRLFLHFFPLTCPACKSNSINYPNELCEECLSKLSFIQEPYCNSCGGSNNTIFEICSNCMQEDKHLWNHALSVFEMENLSRDLIIKYKYYKDTPLVRPLGKFCIDRINKSELDIDVTTYIPLHWIKYLKRGFNQSQLICKHISKHLNIPTKTLLRRTRFTKSQTKLSTNKRRKNIVGAFKALNGASIKNKKILLVDDVYTTGSTLREASKILLNAKARNLIFVIRFFSHK